MKIQLLKENLQQAVKLVGRFATQKAQLPVLSYIALTASDEGIYLGGTDLEMGVRLRVAGKVIEQGEVGVPAKLLMELVDTLPLGAVELSGDGKLGVKIEAGRVKATLQGGDLADFPELGKVGKEDLLLGDFEVKDLTEALNRVEYAVSSDESRVVLTGILWDFGRGRIVATDGYRLSVLDGKRYQMKREGAEEKPILISGSFLQAAIKTAGDLGEQKVTLAYVKDKRQLFLMGGDVVVAGRVLEGDYPKYEAIIPSDFTIGITASKQDLMQAVRAASIFARDSAHIVRLEIEGKHLVVSANSPQVGENRIEVEVETQKEGEVHMAFNGKYLSDFLSHAESDRVVIEVTEALKAGVFKEEGVEGFEHVIMPVRVREAD